MIPLGLIAFGRTWWRAFLGAVLVFPLAFMLGQCDGRAGEKSRQKAQQQQARADATQRARTADQALSERRTASDAAIAANRKDVDDATAKIPDNAPSARQRARACVELRRTGRLDPNAPC